MARGARSQNQQVKCIHQSAEELKTRRRGPPKRGEAEEATQDGAEDPLHPHLAQLPNHRLCNDHRCDCRPLACLRAPFDCVPAMRSEIWPDLWLLGLARQPALAAKSWLAIRPPFMHPFPCLLPDWVTCSSCQFQQQDNITGMHCESLPLFRKSRTSCARLGQASRNAPAHIE